VAMMLEADPTLTPAEVREIIMLTARTDSHTGIIPTGGSTQWGAGKVNAYKAVREVLGINHISEHSAAGQWVYPNPTDAMLNLRLTYDSGKIDLRLTDLSGRTIFEETHLNSGFIVMDLRGIPAGIYFLQKRTNGLTETTKVIKR